MTLTREQLDRLAAKAAMGVDDGEIIIGVPPAVVLALVKVARKQDALRAEVAELRATLAAERGDPEGALPGWRWEDRLWLRKAWWRQADKHLLIVSRGAKSWTWRRNTVIGHNEGHPWYAGQTEWETYESPEGMTAREAMRAADAALEAAATPTTPEGGER